MCTSIVEIVDAEGKGKDGNSWFKLRQAVVCYDHPHHALLEEAITIDFMNGEDGIGKRTAVSKVVRPPPDVMRKNAPENPR